MTGGLGLLAGRGCPRGDARPPDDRHDSTVLIRREPILEIREQRPRERPVDDLEDAALRLPRARRLHATLLGVDPGALGARLVVAQPVSVRPIGPQPVSPRLVGTAA